MKRLALVLCVLVCAAQAQKGKFTTYTTTWNKLTRQYSVYVPPVLQAHPAMVMALHGTAIVQENNPPLTACTKNMAWDALADSNGFLLICPVATWKAIGTAGQFFWESYGTDNYFPVNPDDSGFLRSLVVAMEKPTTSGGYGVDPNRVFVMGFSTGAFMSHRACVEMADLVAACSPVSGVLWVQDSSIVIPPPSRPVSIFELRGDEDTTIWYCGGLFWAFGEGHVPVPGVDVDVNYWLGADGLGPNTTPLCSNTNPAPNVFGVDFKSADGKTEVQFAREIGYDHTFKVTTISTVWEFFSNHGR